MINCERFLTGPMGFTFSRGGVLEIMQSPDRFFSKKRSLMQHLICRMQIPLEHGFAWEVRIGPFSLILTRSRSQCV